MYRVVKDYKALKPDELDLKQGQLVELNSASGEDPGQFSVTLDGHTGSVPVDCLAVESPEVKLITPGGTPHPLMVSKPAIAGPVSRLKSEEGKITLSDYSTDSDSEIVNTQAKTRTYVPAPSRTSSGKNKKYQRSLSLPKNEDSTASEMSGVDSTDDASTVLSAKDHLSSCSEEPISVANNDTLLNSPSRSASVSSKEFNNLKYRSLSAPEDKRAKGAGSLSSLTRSISKSLSRDNISLYAQHLSSSKKNEFVILKLTFAVLMSLITGGVIMGSLFVGGRLTVYEAAYISGGFTLLSFFGLVISRKTRAVYAIMLPSLCATRGQTVIMSLAFSFLFNGPVQAILANMEQVGVSMACHSELALNQSLQIMELYTSPMAQLQQHFEASLLKLESLKDIYDDPVKTVVDALNDTSNKLNEIVKELESYEDSCKSEASDVTKSCLQVFDDLKSFCKKYKEIIDNEKDNMDALVDGEKIDENAKDGNTFEDGTDTTIQIDLMPQEAENRDVAEKETNSQTTSSNKLKSSEDDVCAISDSDNICEGTGDIMHISGCYPASQSLQLAKASAKLVRAAADEVIKQFDYSIEYNFETNSTSSQSSSAEEIEERIIEQFQKWKPYLQDGAKIGSIMMALFFLTILHKSYSYISKFVQDVSYDNHYVSEALQSYLNANNKTLRKSELRKLVRLFQWKRTAKENKRIFYSLITSAVYTTTALCILFFNAFFYYTLLTIREYGQTEVEFSADNDITFNVKGDGLMGDVVGIFIDSFHFSNNLTTVSNNQQCLPNPVKTENEFLINSCIFICFMVFYFTIVAQTWVLRFRHIICAMFFDGTEEARLIWLSKKVTYQIENRDLIVGQNVMKSFYEQKTREQHLEFGLIRKLSKLSRKFHGYCFACRRTTWGKHKKITCNEHFIDCRTVTLKMSYCIPCNLEIHNACVLCKLGIVDLEHQGGFGMNMFMNASTYQTSQKSAFQFPTSIDVNNKVAPSSDSPTVEEIACSKA